MPPLAPPKPLGPPPAVDRKRTTPPLTDADIDAITRPAASTAESDVLTGSELYDTVRSLTYSGKMEEAAQYCEALITSNPLNADHHCMLALVYLEDHSPSKAYDALRRAVYCDPDCLTAFYLWWLIGVRYHNPRWERMRWAKRHLRRLLTDLPDTHPVPLVGGVTAGDIRYLMERTWGTFNT